MGDVQRQHLQDGDGDHGAHLELLGQVVEVLQLVGERGEVEQRVQMGLPLQDRRPPHLLAIQ